MVVGDDYQSIYGFRGADFTNILKFGEDFSKSKLIKLEKNYRSSEEIIAYTNRIANNFKIKYNKKICGTGRRGREYISTHLKMRSKREDIFVKRFYLIERSSF